MSVPTSEVHDVWTYDDSHEWLRRNIVADMRLVHGLSRDAALITAERMALRFPEATFEVRDVHGTVVRTFGAERGELARPVPTPHRGRRTLGSRGQ